MHLHGDRLRRGRRHLDALRALDADAVQTGHADVERARSPRSCS